MVAGAAMLTAGSAVAGGMAVQADATRHGDGSSGAQQRAADAPLVADDGLVAVPSEDGVLVSWRSTASQESSSTAKDSAFHVFRDGKRLTEQPVRDTTSFLDENGSVEDTYEVRPVRDDDEARAIGTVRPWKQSSMDIPIEQPEGGTTPAGEDYTYEANDASTGDLDGDGEYEIVLSWQPSNAKDNSQSGYTGPTYLDAYELDGTRLWRIDLGPNIRSGAHYSPFVVYDLDDDDTAEVALRTSDGTVDGEGNVLGDADADHRNSDGYVLSGPEFLSIFDGSTGAELQSIDYQPERGDPCDWGDCYGNRVDRFLAGVAYLDGDRPSLVMTRGYYTRSVLVAYDWRDGELTERWTFDSDEQGTEYAGQGNHQLSVADADTDGRDEIIYGALTVDDDGSPLSNTGLGHGDALHAGDFDPDRPGVEVFGVHEDSSAECGYEMHDPETGEVLWCEQTGEDTGRGTAGDIDPRHPGAEAWAAGAVHGATGERIADGMPAANFVIWWDGDPSREILDHSDGVGTIGKWDGEGQTTEELLSADGTHAINGTKANPSLQADLVGDWREEVLWPTDDQQALRLFSTPYETEHEFPSLMEDRQYRTAIAWQNAGYNQPPHPSFALGE